MQYQKKSTSTYSDKNMQRKQIEYDLGVLNEKRISKEHMLVAISVVALLLVTLAFKKWPWIKKTFLSLRNRSNGELADKTKDVKADEIENHENSEVSNEKPFSLERREGQLEETASTVSTKMVMKNWTSFFLMKVTTILSSRCAVRMVPPLIIPLLQWLEN